MVMNAPKVTWSLEEFYLQGHLFLKIAEFIYEVMRLNMNDIYFLKMLMFWNEYSDLYITG